MDAQKITIPRLVAALKRVPEKRLALFDLAPQLLDEKGRAIDYRKVVDRQREVNLALAEAEAYSQATASAVRALLTIGGQPAETVDELGDVELDGEDEDE